MTNEVKILLDTDDLVNTAKEEYGNLGKQFILSVIQRTPYYEYIKTNYGYNLVKHEPLEEE